MGRPTSPALPFVREFLRLQAEAPRRSLFSRVFGLDPVARTAARAYAGALAELRVAEVLDRLGEGWTVLDAVPVGADEAPVEHLLIGPPGVISIALRNHAGERVWVGERTFVADGARLPHLRDIEHESEIVAARMSAAVGAPVTVRPCLVLSSPVEFRRGEAPRTVEIFLPGQLATWLAELPRILSPETVDRYRDAGLAADTWYGARTADAHLAGPPACDAARERAGFERAACEQIRRDVARARRRRLGWILLGLLA